MSQLELKDHFIQRGFVLCQLDEEQEEHLRTLFKITVEASLVEYYRKKYQEQEGILIFVMCSPSTQTGKQTCGEYYLYHGSQSGTTAFFGEQIIKNVLPSLGKLNL